MRADEGAAASAGDVRPAIPAVRTIYLLSAAFLGAGLWGTSVAAFLASLERFWDRTWIVLPPVTVLMVLSLAATFMHHDTFDFESSFGWAWLVVYIAFPAVVLVLAAEQRRTTGGPSRRQPFPLWMTAALATLATIILASGIALFLEPEETPELWAWALTPLTGRIIGSWLAGMAAVTAVGAAGLAVVHLGMTFGQRAPKTASSSSGTGRSSWS